MCLIISYIYSGMLSLYSLSLNFNNSTNNLVRRTLLFCTFDIIYFLTQLIINYRRTILTLNPKLEYDTEYIKEYVCTLARAVLHRLRKILRPLATRPYPLTKIFISLCSPFARNPPLQFSTHLVVLWVEMSQIYDLAVYFLILLIFF
jgi:hypothetical protein